MRPRRHNPKFAETGVTIRIATPTLDKMLANKGESQSIGNFLTWLQEQRVELATYCGDQLVLKHFQIEELLAEYFGVDLAQAERERRKILAAIR